MTTFTATYSPEDNKLRLYASSRLDAETYERVRAAGFRWAPKQELFVAPMWTPAREDLLVELAGDIGDEDTSLVERAEAKAERLEDLSARRASEAVTARAAVDKIADGIPLGQPILVGHHSERHARKDAAKITAGMRKVVTCFEQSEYWASRAKGAIRLAKYKERPDVRARRIKGLEADLRKIEKTERECQGFLKAWNSIQEGDNQAHAKALHICNYSHISRCFPLADYPRSPPASLYEGDMSLWSALEGGVITWQQAKGFAVACYETGSPHRARWIAHYQNRLAYERAMLGEAGGTATDQTKPEKGGAIRGHWTAPGHGQGWSIVQKVNKVSVTIHFKPSYGDRVFPSNVPLDKISAVMTAAQVQEARDTGMLVNAYAGMDIGFFLRTEAPTPPVPKAAPSEAEVAAGQMKEALKAGVQIAVAPQLFPTPQPLAEKMASYAGLEPGAHVLEPSAGTGILVDVARRSVDGDIRLTAIEVNPKLAEGLRARFPDVMVHNYNFLDIIPDPTNLFDTVLMNPPFENGADIQHIQRAQRFLKPGGRLVAICANGPRQRAAFMDSAEHWEDLPAGTFAQQGTQVNTALLVLRAPS